MVSYKTSRVLATKVHVSGITSMTWTKIDEFTRQTR